MSPATAVSTMSGFDFTIGRAGSPVDERNPLVGPRYDPWERTDWLVRLDTRTEQQQTLYVMAAVQAPAANTLAVARQEAAADVGIERGCLDTEQRTRLAGGEELLAVQIDHDSA